MRLSAALFSLILAAFQLPAATLEPVPVDVSAATTQVLNPTDKLLFTVMAANYSAQASRRGLSSLPSLVSFQFVSMPEPAPGEFTAWWQAADGSLVAAFPGTLSWLTGQIQSFGYTGPVSVLYGSMALTSTAAAEMFAGGSATLVLENEGGPITVGLPPYTLGQDLTVTFSTRGLGVAGQVTGEQYLDPPPVPEPPSGLILLAVGVGLCCVSRAVNQISDRHVK